MKCLIVEDEARVARQLEKMLRMILKEKITRLEICSDLQSAKDYLKSFRIDLLFLDLNLDGENGFNLLSDQKKITFQTIITSAYRDKAIDAFEFNVLDFVPKPFELDRLESALDRFGAYLKNQSNNKYLMVKKLLNNQLIEINRITHLKAIGHQTEINLDNGKAELYHKSLQHVLKILPNKFLRVHKSFAIDQNQIDQLNKEPGNRQEIVLKNGIVIPIGRTYYNVIKSRMI